MVDFRQLIINRREYQEGVWEELITLRTDEKEFVFPYNALLDEIYLKITINDVLKGFKEQFAFEHTVIEPIKIEIANREVVINDKNAEAFALSFDTNILGIEQDLRYSSFKKVGEDLFFSFRLAVGIPFKKMSSFRLYNNQPLNFSYPHPTIRFLFTDRDDLFNFNWNRKLSIFVIPVSYNEPYIVISPTTGDYVITKAYYFNVWRIWKIQKEEKENYFWKTVKGEHIDEYLSGGVEIIYDTILPSPFFSTEQFYYNYQTALRRTGILFENMTSPYPYYKTHEFTDIRRIRIRESWNEKLVLYGGRFGANPIPYVVLIFETEVDEEVEDV